MLKKLLLSTLLTLSAFGYEIVIDKSFKPTRDNLKNIVYDRSTNLIWQDNGDAKAILKDWSGSKKYCQNLTLADYHDWYLPSKEELLSIVDKNRKPTIKDMFQNISSNHYCSLSSSTEHYALNVFFYYGRVYSDVKDNSFYVRCVRAGQFDNLTLDNLTFDSLISKLIEAELKTIPKPPSELKLVKDQFETTGEFHARVAKTKKKQKAMVAKYKKKYALVQKKVAIKIPRKYAKSFYKEYEKLKVQAVFDYDGSSVKPQEIRASYKKQRYLALFTDMSLDDTRVAVNLKNDISYAKRSAEMFKKVMKKKLGISEQNCYTMIDEKASQAVIKTNLKKLLRRVKKGDTIYFYYNGHGIPIPSLRNEPFMLANDSSPDYISDEKFFSLQNIYSKLSDSKAKKIVAVVDSCFSGVTDGKAILKGVAATKMVAKSVHFDKEKMVILG